MRLPIDNRVFSEFIEESDIFRLTRESMKQCLKNWYNDGREQFVDAMRADFDTVMKTYHFYDTVVSFNKNFNFDPPLDTITCITTINDGEDDYCTAYYDLNIIDDAIS